jgi:cytochrome c oxidase subunit 2
MNKKSSFVIALLGTAAGVTISAGLPARPLVFAAAATGSTTVAKSGHPAPADQPKVVQIVAHKFAFEPNRITLKKGVPVTIQLTSRDVKHGFYIRGLKVDEEIEPGKTTEITITPDKAGTFPTICDHLCGLGHKKMNMIIVVEE